MRSDGQPLGSHQGEGVARRRRPLLQPVVEVEPVRPHEVGKVRVAGVTYMGRNQKVFALEYLQARDASLVGRPFFARYNPRAVWWEDLLPASEHDREFFPEYSLHSSPCLSKATWQFSPSMGPPCWRVLLLIH